MSPLPRRLLMAVLLLLALGFARLGVWQLSRLHQRRAANRVTLAARSSPPVLLPGSALRGTDTLLEHRVIARGRYDHGHDIVLRGEALQGVPGVHVVTPLRMAGTDRQPGMPEKLKTARRKEALDNVRGFPWQEPQPARCSLFNAGRVRTSPVSAWFRHTGCKLFPKWRSLSIKPYLCRSRHRVVSYRSIHYSESMVVAL